MTKYGNIIHKVDGLRFDSTLERDVYVMLRTYFPQIKINVHGGADYEPVPIKPATARFPARVWKVDFYLPQLNLYVEAKGVRTGEWKTQLAYLDYFNPEVLDRLIVISEAGGEKVFKGCYTMTLSQFRQFLESRLAASS